MYEVNVVYKKRLKLKTISQVYTNETYEQTMDSLKQLLEKRHIRESQILSYNIVKIIKCKKCLNEIHLTKNQNCCRCGCIYNIFGAVIHNAAAEPLSAMNEVNTYGS